MTEKDYKRFLKLRLRLFKMIKSALEEDPCHKSYEGAIEIIGEFPNYFEVGEAIPMSFEIRVHCYVVGPSRHYSFVGATAKQALDKFESALVLWGKRIEADGAE